MSLVITLPNIQEYCKSKFKFQNLINQEKQTINIRKDIQLLLIKSKKIVIRFPFRNSYNPNETITILITIETVLRFPNIKESFKSQPSLSS